MNKRPLVLIVEDNIKNLRLVKDILEYHGYRTIQATSGREGIDLARRGKPDLIIMDMQMPGIDGLQATRVLKGEEGTSPIPIIALTAMAMKGGREKIMGVGCNGYLQKPIRFDALVEAVKQWI